MSSRIGETYEEYSVKHLDNIETIDMHYFLNLREFNIDFNSLTVDGIKLHKYWTKYDSPHHFSTFYFVPK